MREREVFIEDEKSDMTPEQKNTQLSAELVGRLIRRLIVRIDRIEIGSRGWRVTYRLPDPQD